MIRLENVSKIYPGQGEPIIEGLNLEIQSGEICVLVGESGCGKTTTMRMINKVIPHTGGTIYVDGKDISTINATELRLNIGYVIQEIGLFPHYTIEKNIATVPNEKKWAKERVAARVKEMMELVELDYDTYAKKKPRHLSGGQRQRVGVARALAADPPIMLMDEPFGALDPITRAHIQDEFIRIQARIKKTIVFVTHDIDEAVKMGDKIAVMHHGKLVQFGTPQDILTRPTDEFVENLVGHNRILKRFSLVECRAIKPSAAVFKITGERDEIIRRIESFERTSSFPVIGIIDDDCRPIGYIPMFKYEAGDETPIENRVKKVKAVQLIDERATLFDALGRLFSSSERCVFRMTKDGICTGIITMGDLFEAVRVNG
ncbi:MAG: ABC transporter ATP-binding protein [Defluviitaleaceae bacterium]|nr:ABC transporter ATP-binding protein [Defluviitaleaceae bacterium]